MELSEDDERKNVLQFGNITLTTRKAIRKMLERIEVHLLKLAAKRLVDVKDTDNIVTHVTDSTTQKRVGCFAPQGLHVNKDTSIPLPTLQMGS